MLHPVKCWYNTTMMKCRYEFCAMSCIEEFGFKFIELGFSQVRRHLAGSTVKIRRWQISPSHCLGGTIKKKHITYLGAFLHNPETPAYHSLKVSRSECICTVAFAKYSTQSVKMCILVTDQRHKLETCSTVTRTTENTDDLTGFT